MTWDELNKAAAEPAKSVEIKKPTSAQKTGWEALNAQAADTIKGIIEKPTLTPLGDTVFNKTPFEKAQGVSSKKNTPAMPSFKAIETEPIRINTGISRSTPLITTKNWKDTLNDTVTGVARFALPAKTEQRLNISPGQGEIDVATPIVKGTKTAAKATGQAIKTVIKGGLDAYSWLTEKNQENYMRSENTLREVQNRAINRSNANLIKKLGSEEKAKQDKRYQEPIKVFKTTEEYQNYVIETAPAYKALNSPTGKKIINVTAESTSNLFIKGLAAVQAIGDQTYQEAYQALLIKRNDPNNNAFTKFMYDLQDSLPQTAIGLLIALGISAVSKNPTAGRVFAGAYYASLSSAEQIQTKGRVDNLTNVAIDTVGDSVLGSTLEGLFKKQLKKSFYRQAGESFITEGGTEVAQSLLKYSTDYAQAKTSEAKQKVIEEAKKYVKEGGMVNEFLVGGVAGGVIGAGANLLGGNVSPSMQPKKETQKQAESVRTKLESASEQVKAAVNKNEDPGELIGKAETAKNDFNQYVKDNKVPVLQFGSSPESGQINLELVRYDNGTYGIGYEAVYGAGELISPFDSNISYDDSQSAILDATSKILGWAQEQNPVTEQEQTQLNNIVKNLNDFLNGQATASQENDGEIDPFVEERANDEWENNPKYADRVGELSDNRAKLEKEFKETKDKAKKSELRAEIDKINSEINKINESFISRWRGIAKEERRLGETDLSVEDVPGNSKTDKILKEYIEYHANISIRGLEMWLNSNLYSQAESEAVIKKYRQISRTKESGKQKKQKADKKPSQKKEEKPEPEKKEKKTVEKVKINKKIELTTEPETEEEMARAAIESEMLVELEMATPGRKNFIRDENQAGITVTAEKSTFPSWLPQGLRLNSIIRPTLEAIYAGKLPEKANEKRLYNLIYKRINEKEDVELPEEINLSDIKFLRKNNKALTIKTFDFLEGKKSVSKQFIEDLTKRQDIKQVERDLIMDQLKGIETDKVDVASFIKQVNAELLPLSVESSEDGEPRYENVTLPDSLRGPVASYYEHVYNSPIATAAGSIHFGDEAKNYFGHSRIEDMASGDVKITGKDLSGAPIYDMPDQSAGPEIRRIIEVQTDLYQRGRLGDEVDYKEGDLNTFYQGGDVWGVADKDNNIIQSFGDGRNPNAARKQAEEYILKNSNRKDLKRLQQYNDPTAHFRMVREEVKFAAKDGIKKLQFPTGVTAMQIEGLSQTSWWKDATTNIELKPDNLTIGKIIQSPSRAGNWLITQVLESGKFKAISKNRLDLALPEFKNDINKFLETGIIPEKTKPFLLNASESFDISGKVDINNPIYKFYENTLGRYLKNRYGAKQITDKQGVSWYEIEVNKEDAKKPVEAFLRDVGEFVDRNQGIKALDDPFDGQKLYERLEKTMKRLGLNFDISLFDKIYTGEMAKKVITKNGVQTLRVIPEEASGVVYNNRLAISKNAVRFADYHELIHIISENISDIPAFSKYNKQALLEEANKIYGKKYREENFEEVMARGFEDFVYRRKTFTGRLRAFLGQILYQIKQILNFNRRVDLRSFYEDVLYSKAGQQTFISPGRRFGKVTQTAAGRTLDFSREIGANYLRLKPEPSVSVSETKPASTPEELALRIEQLNKVGQKSAILRRAGKISNPRAAGVFLSGQSDLKMARGVGKEGEIRLRDSYVAARQQNYVAVLAHETGHAIDAALNGGQTNVDIYKVFGDKLTEKQKNQLREELRNVTVDLVGQGVYAKNPGYYNKPTELLARFFEKMFVSPTDLPELAPLASELVEKNQIKHPIIADMLEAAAGAIDKGQLKFIPLADRRDSYHKYLGKAVGEIAFNEEMAHRAMLERGKYVIEKFVKEKFKDVKDAPELLFRAAESIKITRGDRPEFGTRDFVIAKNEVEEKDLLDAGWERVRIEGTKMQVEKEVDGVMYPLFVRQRYTKEEGKALYDQLSPAGKRLINDFTAARDEAKDYFNREVIKDVNKIDSEIEGWVHHYFPQEYAGTSGTTRKLRFKNRTAGAKQRRTGAEGYIEDLQLNMLKAMTDLESAKNFNEFIRKQFARVTKPLLKGQQPDRGWVEVQGDVFKGAGTPQEKRIVIVKGDKSFVAKRNSYQMPKIIYERYKLYAGLIEESSKAVRIINDLNRYWRVNILTHIGSAGTNFLSGGLQYGSKVMTDFYTELLTGQFNLPQTRRNVAAMVQALLPKGWSESPDWVFGGDRSNFYGQFTETQGTSKIIDTYANTALKLYGAVERYWKKVITISEMGRTLKGLEKMTVEGLREPSKLEKDLIAEINSQVDLYAYDYDNVPLWLENHSKSPLGQAIKPFAKYPYKYAKQILNMTYSVFDRTIPWQERAAKLLSLATIMTAYGIYKRKRDDERETPAGDENTPARLSPRGRMFVGTDKEGYELFVRTAKYPFLNLSDAGTALAKGNIKEAKDVVADLLGGLHPVTELALMTATDYESEYDRYLPVGVKIGNRVATFIPLYRILNDVSQYFDTFQRKQEHFYQSFTRLIPTTNEDLRRKLRGEIRTEEIPLEGEFKPSKPIKGQTRTTFDRELRSWSQDVALAFLTGIYVRRIDPEAAKAVQIRTDSNAREKAASEAIKQAAEEYVDKGGLKIRFKKSLVNEILGENPSPKDSRKVRESFDRAVNAVKSGKELEEELIKLNE